MDERSAACTGNRNYGGTKQPPPPANGGAPTDVDQHPASPASKPS
jgi:hypothetical protein